MPRLWLSSLSRIRPRQLSNDKTVIKITMNLHLLHLKCMLFQIRIYVFTVLSLYLYFYFTRAFNLCIQLFRLLFVCTQNINKINKK